MPIVVKWISRREKKEKSVQQELKKTPLNTWHREHGGRMVEFGGWEMPHFI